MPRLHEDLDPFKKSHTPLKYNIIIIFSGKYNKERPIQKVTNTYLSIGIPSPSDPVFDSALGDPKLNSSIP